MDYEGETIVVNLHGALISTSLSLSVGTRISIHVYLTDKRAKARVVYVHSAMHCGIELEKPRNIWECLCHLQTGKNPNVLTQAITQL